MIGAEIVALIVIVLGTGLGFRALGGWGKSRALRRKHSEELGDKMRAEMRVALETKGHAAIDAFLVLWDFNLSKAEKEKLIAIRDDRVIEE